MKRPTWATVIGVLGIIFGCLGVLGSIQFALTPMMMEFQEKMLAIMQQTMEAEAAENGSDVAVADMMAMMEQLWDLPEWYASFCVAAGMISAVVAGLYIFASIRLLQVHPSAVGTFYLAMGLSIAMALVIVLMSIAASSMMAIAMGMGGMFGIVIDVVLLIVVATADKRAYRGGGG